MNRHHAFDRILDALASSLNPVAARSLVAARVDPEILARVVALAERANEGQLSPDEHDEFLSIVEAADRLALLKLKASRRFETLP